MQLTFLGTRALTETSSPRHALNSALLIRQGKTRVLIDCGSDWRGRLTEIEPRAIFVTHAHSDHAEGLEKGAPCPVFATEATWQSLQPYPLQKKHLVLTNIPVQIDSLTFEAVPVHHSERAPCVGFRISSEKTSIFYSSDVALLPEPENCLRDIRLYIGDGSSFCKPLLRNEKGGPFGHASIGTQLSWCVRGKVPKAVFTHCGEELILDANARIEKEILTLGEKLGVEVLIAFDGLEINIP